ncbi:hypothetical protein CTheo_9138 [Ceratobasidium theobromae]|uniref:PH domain-containing protein n=1 Tax=Ceratobasidium theobromae TaxID=1582974 RepID=A0A5N5Q6K5_9AGAM|nr:hypothetical protein CTheo_9138 [Ceratobasidium theobromae]
MMSPAGNYKWYAWSLLWQLDWPGKHMELVHIDNIRDMTLEYSKHYRNNNEPALWLNTGNRFSYALMEPDDTVAQEWIRVIQSWQSVAGDGPAFCLAVDPTFPPPSWWQYKGNAAGKKQWQGLVSRYNTSKRQEELEESDDDIVERLSARVQLRPRKNIDKAPREVEGEGKGKGKGKGEEKASVKGKGSGAGKGKREEEEEERNQAKRPSGDEKTSRAKRQPASPAKPSAKVTGQALVGTSLSSVSSAKVLRKRT